MIANLPEHELHLVTSVAMTGDETFDDSKLAISKHVFVS